MHRLFGRSEASHIIRLLTFIPWRALLAGLLVAGAGIGVAVLAGWWPRTQRELFNTLRFFAFGGFCGFVGFWLGEFLSDAARAALAEENERLRRKMKVTETTEEV